MRILILGGDGYLGWPTAMHFAMRGHEVTVFDNYLRRRIALQTDSEPLLPLPPLPERARRFELETGKHINVVIGDCCDHEYLLKAVQEASPEAIVHYAEQPSAPYSMADRSSARLTLENNLGATFNLIWAVLEAAPDCHIIKLGTMGEYGTPNIDIEEGWIDINHKLVRLVGKRSPRLLDFGSGFGRWARAAARAGFQVHAYEPSTARGAESVDEFTLVHDLAEIDGMKFDAINLEQVLEHVPAPLDTLHQIRAYMEPNSILRIRVPNITRSLEGPEIWRVWPYDGTHVHVMAPFEHLHGFTPESFIALSRRADLRVISGLRFAFTHPKAWFRERFEF